MSSFANLTFGPYSSSSWRRTGSTARQGPHQGAQKSTIDRGLGLQDLLLEGRVGQLVHKSNATAASRAPGAAVVGTFQIASSTMPRLIFEPPALPVDEGDRHLDDTEAGPERAVGRLDLEGVAA